MFLCVTPFVSVLTFTPFGSVSNILYIFCVDATFITPFITFYISVYTFWVSVLFMFTPFVWVSHFLLWWLLINVFIIPCLSLHSFVLLLPICTNSDAFIVKSHLFYKKLSTHPSEKQWPAVFQDEAAKIEIFVLLRVPSFSPRKNYPLLCTLCYSTPWLRTFNLRENIVFLLRSEFVLSLPRTFVWYHLTPQM